MIEVWFNGTKLNDSFHVANIDRPLPEFTNALTAIEGRDGAVFDGTRMEPRTCTMDLFALDRPDTGLQRAARELMGVLAVSEPAPLVFSDERGPGGEQLTRYAVPDGSTGVQTWVRQFGEKFTVSFKQPDPYLYGKERVGVLEKGVTYILETGGNAPAYPTFEATPSAQHGLFQVGVFYGSQNNLGGYDYRGKVTFNGNYVDGSGNAFSGTNKLWCDMEAQAVTFQRMAYDPGKPVKGLTLDSRFFSIQGRERIRAEFADVTMTWRERWL